MKISFLVNEATIEHRLGSILEKLKLRHNPREPASQDGCENEGCASTHFLQLQKKH